MRDFPGEYVDGGGAHRTVSVRIGRNGVRVFDAGETELAFWRYRDIRLVDALGAGRPARLMLAGGSARLAIDSEAVPHLAGAGLGQRAGRLGGRALLIAAGALVAVLALGAGALWLVPRLPALTAHLVPAAMLESLGERLAARMVAVRARETGAAGVCAEPAGVAALEGLVAGLTHGTGRRFAAQVLDAPDARVLALPGGRLMISRGLLEQSESGADMVAVLARAIAETTSGRLAERLVGADGIALLFGAALGRRDPNPTAAEVAAEVAVFVPPPAPAPRIDAAAAAILAGAEPPSPQAWAAIKGICRN